MGFTANGTAHGVCDSDGQCAVGLAVAKIWGNYGFLEMIYIYIPKCQKCVGRLAALADEEADVVAENRCLKILIAN
jgi:hypothetical protein